MSKRGDLPVMLGRNLRKGLLAIRNTKMGGFDLYVIWLKSEYKTGTEFGLSDIEKVDSVLHFCDTQSVKTTIDILKKIIEMW